MTATAPVTVYTCPLCNRLTCTCPRQMDIDRDTYDAEPPRRSMTTAEQLARDKHLLAAHVLNLLGEDRHENFVPRMTLDLASTLKLEIEETPVGCWVRRKITNHGMGS